MGSTLRLGNNNNKSPCIGLLVSILKQLKMIENELIKKRWYTKKELSKLGNVSEKTIDRKKKSLLELNPELDWFKDKSKPHKFNYKMLQEFVSPAVFQLTEENRQQKNTIDCLSSPGTLQYHLSHLEWDYFITISWEQNFNKDRCRSEMDSLYEDLCNYGFNGKNRMFYSTEPFTNRKGCHNHFALKLEGSNPITIKEFIEKNSPRAIIDVKKWDNYKAGMFYIVKEGLNGCDWDLHGNDLTSEGEELMIRFRRS